MLARATIWDIVIRSSLGNPRHVHLLKNCLQNNNNLSKISSFSSNSNVLTENFKNLYTLQKLFDLFLKDILAYTQANSEGYTCLF